MSRPAKYKRKFRVTATMDVTFVVWGDSEEQVERALDNYDHDELFDNVGADIEVQEEPAAPTENIDAGVVTYNDDDPPELMNAADLPFTPVDSPELDDDYRPTPADLEEAGQIRMEGT